jgi:hypothetical protein
MLKDNDFVRVLPFGGQDLANVALVREGLGSSSVWGWCQTPISGPHAGVGITEVTCGCIRKSVSVDITK